MLDPDDPLLVEDAAYTAWRSALAANERAIIGLRVRWLWPQSHMDQAADAREFRVYVHNGRRNALIGKTAGVTASSPTESAPQTDIVNGRAVDAYVGTRLLIGDAGFRVIGSDATTPLRVRVENNGPGRATPPPANASCSIVIPETIGAGASGQPHPLFLNFATAASWDERYYVVPVGDFVSDEVVVCFCREAAGTKAQPNVLGTTRNEQPNCILLRPAASAPRQFGQGRLVPYGIHAQPPADSGNG